MMLLSGTCTKCGTTIQIDVGEITDEEEARIYAREALKNQSMGFSCPGHHVEIVSPYPNFWNVDTWKLVDGNAATEEEFLAKLKANYKEVLDTDEMYKRDVIVGFAYGIPVTNDGLIWNFAESPEGKRYYFHD